MQETWSRKVGSRDVIKGLECHWGVLSTEVRSRAEVWKEVWGVNWRGQDWRQEMSYQAVVLTHVCIQGILSKTEKMQRRRSNFHLTVLQTKPLKRTKVLERGWTAFRNNRLQHLCGELWTSTSSSIWILQSPLSPPENKWEDTAQLGLAHVLFSLTAEGWTPCGVSCRCH